MEATFLGTQTIAIIKNLPRSECESDEEETLKALALHITKALTELLGCEIEVIISSINYELILKGINFFDAVTIKKLTAFFGESTFHRVDDPIEIIIPRTRSRIICS